MSFDETAATCCKPATAAIGRTSLPAYARRNRDRDFKKGPGGGDHPFAPPSNMPLTSSVVNRNAHPYTYIFKLNQPFHKDSAYEIRSRTLIGENRIRIRI